MSYKSAGDCRGCKEPSANAKIGLLIGVTRLSRVAQLILDAEQEPAEELNVLVSAVTVLLLRIGL